MTRRARIIVQTASVVWRLAGLGGVLRNTLMGVLVGLAMFAAPIAGGVAHAFSPEEQLKDRALEARARELSAELRCLVCQNQSIDDSDAPLAKDLRRLVRERLVAGDSKAEVKRFLVERYGDFVLLKPPFGWHTLGLWLAPFMVLALTIYYVVYAARSRQNMAGATGAKLSADEEARLAELMRASPPEGEVRGDGRS